MIIAGLVDAAKKPVVVRNGQLVCRRPLRGRGSSDASPLPDYSRAKSLSESIDTTTPGGKLIFHVFGALAEFERELIRERTGAGLASARARGRKGGRPKSLDEKRRAQAMTLHKDPSNSIADICRTLKIGRTTLYRYLGETDPRKAGRKAKTH